MPTSSDMRIAYLTAGAAGMFCGSCMHDNTLARALVREGVDVVLTPLYTPIRTDEDNVSVDRVFYGGISVYLEQKLPWLAAIPGLGRLLDRPSLIRWATARGIKTSARELGALTVSVLRGERGRQAREVRKLCSWLTTDVRPTLVNLSNMLIAGCVPTLKRMLNVPVVVTLQGDDIFLDDLPEPYRSQAFDELRRLVGSIDAFLVNSRYYADHMAGYLGLPPEKLRIVPLGLDAGDFPAPDIRRPASEPERPPTIGYLARLAPEKGLHVLVDAFVRLAQRPGMERARLRVAGWMAPDRQTYLAEQRERLAAAGLADRFDYVGSIDRAEKVAFLQSLDVLSVPTTYREPKGLFVLESLAAGVPVVQPEHGAFTELLKDLDGGRLVRPNDAAALADGLEAVLRLPQPERAALGERGRNNVLARRSAPAMARVFLDAIADLRDGMKESFTAQPQAPASTG